MTIGMTMRRQYREANLLGRLMCGQHALFYSNLVGWFLDQFPKVDDATLGPLAAPLGWCFSAVR